MNHVRALPIVVGALCALSAPGPVLATGTVSAVLQVTAEVPAACAIDAGATLAFGTYSSASNLDGSATINVTCTNGTAYQVGLGAGAGSGATVAARKMTGPSGTLTYSLYSDAGRTIVWGDTQGSDTVNRTGTGGKQGLTVYGRVPSGQLPFVGSYSDTVAINVYY